MVDDAAIDDGCRDCVAALEPADDRGGLGVIELKHGVFLVVGELDWTVAGTGRRGRGQ